MPAFTRKRRSGFPTFAKVMLAAALCGCVAAGQTQSPPDSAAKPRQTNARPAKVNPALQELLDGAAAAPPEFGADVLIRLSESSRVPTAAAKIDLLSKAFDLASRAELPVKRAGSLGNILDGRSSLLVRAYRLNLDGLSLQSRVISDMLAVDPARARRMVEQVQIPSLPPVGCDQRLTYDLGLFYQALGKVASTAFTAKEKEKGRQVTLLAPFVSNLQSHAQARPVAEMLVEARLSPADLAQLTNTFAGALLQLHGDERSFASAVIGPGGTNASAAVADLFSALEEKQVSVITFLKAWRQYLVTNLADERCATLRGMADSNALPQPAKNFNQQFRRELQTSQIPPIAEEELRNSRIVSPPAAAPYWQSPEAKKLWATLRELRISSPEEDAPSADKTSQAWASRLSDFLEQVEAWQPQDEPASDFFQEKCVLYESLADLIPPGPQRLQVINSIVSLLVQNSGQLPSRIEWFLPAEDLLSGRRAAGDQKEAIQALLNSGDPVLSLYARLERWEPRKNKDAASESNPSGSEKK